MKSRLSQSSTRLAAALLSVLAMAPLASAGYMVSWTYPYEGVHYWHPFTNGLKNLVQIDVKDMFPLVLRNDGIPTYWDQENNVLSFPPEIRDVVQVAAASGGAEYGVAAFLKKDGTVLCWTREEGVIQTPPEVKGIVAVAAGTWGSYLGLKADGRVVGWGSNIGYLTSVPIGLDRVVQLAMDSSASAALRSDGTIVTWGTAKFANKTFEVPGAVQIAVNRLGLYVLKSDGTVVSFGDIAAPAGLNGVMQISAQEMHALALKSDGSLIRWGEANNTGLVTDAPAGMGNALQIKVGSEFQMALIAPSIVKVDRLAIYAGESATGTVRLDKPAGSGGQVVNLYSSDLAVQVPATVRVPAGKTQATFPVSSSLFFGNERQIAVSSSVAGDLGPSVLIRAYGQNASLSLNTPSFVGGSTTKPQLTASLDWPSWLDTVLNLSSNDPSMALPATITIPAGQTSAKVEASHVPVPSDRSVSLDARYQGEKVASASVSVRAMTGRIEMASPRVDAGASVAGVVRLDSVAKSSVVVSLRSDYGSLVVPASVTVPAGAREASFVATAKETAGNRTVSLTGSTGGSPLSGTVRTVAKAEMVAVELSTFLVGCSRTVGRVRIKAASPEGGILVNLASSDPSVKVPSKVLVPAGAYSAEFEATSADVPTLSSAVVTASVGNTATSDSIEVRPLAVSSLTMPSSTKGGTAVTATVTLTANVSVSRTITLSVNDKALATVPTSVLVPAGARSVSFQVVTKSTSSQKTLIISARKNESNVAKTLKINP